MVQFAEDEGSEVPDHLVGGEGFCEHGRVGDPLLRSSHGVGVPASPGLQQGLGGLLVGLLQILLRQPGDVSLSGPSPPADWRTILRKTQTGLGQLR